MIKLKKILVENKKPLREFIGVTMGIVMLIKFLKKWIAKNPHLLQTLKKEVSKL